MPASVDSDLRNLIIGGLRADRAPAAMAANLNGGVAPVDVNDWTLTRSFPSFCWRTRVLRYKAVCHEFTLSANADVRCLVFVDREYPLRVLGVQLLTPVAADAVVLSNVYGGRGVRYLTPTEYQEVCDDEDGEADDECGRWTTTTIEGPLVVTLHEQACYFSEDNGFEPEPPVLEGVLYVGTGKTLEVRYSGAELFDDEQSCILRVYAGDELLHAMEVDDEPTRLTPRSFEGTCTPSVCWRTHVDHLKLYGVDAEAENVLSVEHA